MCSEYAEVKDYLPLNRWTDFGLDALPPGGGIDLGGGLRVVLAFLAGLLFIGADLIWRLIGLVMGFSYTFDMVCMAAGPINSAVRTFALYAAWFLIPAWLFVLAAAMRRWSSGGRQGPAAAVRMMMIFLTFGGILFFVAEQSDEHQNNPTAAYTVPWMAKTVQGWFGEATTDLFKLSQLAGTDTGGGDQANAVFYDNVHAGDVTCAKLDQALYQRYAHDNLGNGAPVGQMEQISQMWELTLVRSWMSAQFGQGTLQYPSPAHAACRLLEARSSVDYTSKLIAYDLSTGGQAATSANQWRGLFISDPISAKTVIIAWGACQGNAKNSGSNGTIPQWDGVTHIPSMAVTACRKLYSSDTFTSDDLSDFNSKMDADEGDVSIFYFKSMDDLSTQLGDCLAMGDAQHEQACHYDRNFVDSWLGNNGADRITQGLISLVVAFIFLRVLGPLAIGLMLISVTLAALAMILPVALLLAAMGLGKGKKLLKLTGSAAAGKFIFTFALTGLVMLIQVTYSAVSATIGTTAPSFLEQVAQAAAPIAALVIFKKLASLMGLGDISQMTGALSLPLAAAARAAGAPPAVAGRVAKQVGSLGVGGARLGVLDQRSLTRRLAVPTLSGAGWAAQRLVPRRTEKPQPDEPPAVDAQPADQPAVDAPTQPAELENDTNSAAPNERQQRGLAAIGQLLILGASPDKLKELADGIPDLAAIGAGAGHTASSQGALTDGQDMAKSLSSGARVPIADNRAAAQEETDQVRQNLIKISGLENQREHIEIAVNKALSSHIEKAWQNPDIRISGPLEKEEARLATAKRNNVSAEDLILTDSGIVLPVPAHEDQNGVLHFRPGATPEEILHPANFLPKETKERRLVGPDQHLEDDEEYGKRIMSHLLVSGCVTMQGEVILRRDPQDPEVQQVIKEGTAKGELPIDQLGGHVTAADPRTSSLYANAVNQWSAAHTPSQEEQERIKSVEAAKLPKEAYNELHDIGQVAVHGKDGSSVTIGQLRDEINSLFRQIAEDVKETHKLPRPDDASDQTAGNVDLRKLEERLNAFEQGLLASELTADALMAKGYLLDPEITKTELKRLIDERIMMASSSTSHVHEALETQLGRLTRALRDADGESAVRRALEDFEKVLNDTITARQVNNDEVIERLTELQEKHRRDPTNPLIDPRQNSSRPPSGAALVQEQKPRRSRRPRRSPQRGS